jgi:hypothetical protein
MKYPAFSFFLTVCFCCTVLSCTLAPNPLKKFNANEDIFYGEVIGFTKLYEKDKWQSEKNVDESDKGRKIKIEISSAYKTRLEEKVKAIGLIVKVAKSIYTPDFTSDVVEVLPFSLMGDCSSQGTYTTESEISKDFPISSKIIVVGTKSIMFPNTNEHENKRIDIGLFNLLSRSNNQTKEFIKEAELEFDYENPGKFPDYSALKFELKKDLYRLEFAKTNKEIMKTLERLAYYPDKYEMDMDYEMIVRNYLNKWGKQDIEDLLKLRKDFVEIIKQKK